MKTAYLFLFVITLSGCQRQHAARPTPAEYVAQIERWDAQRVAELKGEHGWLNLVGLYWLKNGENAFGSDTTNDVVFPEKTPAHMGYIDLRDGKVTISIAPNVNVFHDRDLVSTLELIPDTEGKPTTLKYDSLRWFVIKRGDAFGIRLRDLHSPAIAAFPGIDRFPVDINWRVSARLRAYTPPKEIPIPTVLGTTLHQPSPGALLFSIHGQTFRLDALDNDGGYWVIFGDATNGKETYGGGRFLEIDPPDSSGTLYLDFNKAYNPPCAFTPFATCPLPPAQNRLPVKITAGEKAYLGTDHANSHSN